jgi:peptidoglycan/LPS O-acetylase OafA/YrhL
VTHGDRTSYRPGVDGLRAVAIIAVLLYHGDVSWARGGFLGVSLFFTVSGFLVTRLLLQEHEEHGGIELAAFWGRRARRLLPSALLMIAAVMIAAPQFADIGQRRALPGDAIGAIAYVANWRFFLDGTSYAAQFRGQSPLLHYWSLAIEEQFYLVWPIVVSGILGRYRPRANAQRWLAVAIGGGIAASAVLTQLASSIDRVYYGTDTRAMELLVGAALAVLVTSRSRAERLSRAAIRLAPVSAAVFVVLCGMGRLDDPWVRNGGLGALAVVNVVLVAAAWSDGWVGRALGVTPLRFVGRISYTLYLVHWPVFLFLDARRTELDGVALLFARILVTAAISVTVYHLFECPLRYRRWLRAARPALGTVALTTAGLLIAAAVMPVPASDAVGDGDFVIDSGTTPTERALRVSIVGDGATALEAEMRGDPRINIVTVAATPNCPILPADALRAAPASPSLAIDCQPWDRAWADALNADVELVVIAQGTADLDDQLVGEDWTGLDHLDRLLQYTGELGDIVRAARVEDRFVALVPPRERRARSDVLAAEFERAARGGGVVVAESTDVAGVVDAHHAARLEVGRSWPRPLGERLPKPMRVLVVGDSTSFWFASGLEAASKRRDDLVVGWSGAVSCPMMRLPSYRGVTGDDVDTSECPRFGDEWRGAARVFDPDVVLVVSSAIDAADFVLPGSTAYVGFGDPDFDSLWRSEAEAVLEEFAESGAVVLWADSPGVEMPTRDASTKWNERLARYNELVAEVVAAHPQVGAMSLAAHLGAPGQPVDQTLRPDGVHLTQVAATDAAEAWLIDEIFAAWRTTVTEAVAARCFAGDGPRPVIALERCG